MRSGVDFLQAPDGDVGVDLRPLQTSGAELLLDVPDVAPPSSIKVALKWTCYTLHANRIAGDDNERELPTLVIRPLVRAPFPI